MPSQYRTPAMVGTDARHCARPPDPRNDTAPAVRQHPEAAIQNEQSGFCRSDGRPVKAHANYSVAGQVLAALKRGERLTSGDAWRRFGTSRLAAIVHRLKREGVPIASRIVAVETADGRTAHVARYELPEAAR